MKHACALMLIAFGLASTVSPADDKPSPLSDKERIDALIKQNQMLIEDNMRLRAIAERPKTREEIFATCMQATKGETSAMAAESIGEHCDQLLKR